jgi:hypothetical protein
MIVDCGAPGLSIRWTLRLLTGLGSTGSAGAPFDQGPNALRIDASTAAASKLPTT